MGLLDYADSARKKLAGLLGDMPLVQMAQGRAEMPTMAGLLGALKSMPVFSPDAGQSAYEAALNIGPMGLGKIVYHGSPHKFDKFDASKIGTGEGAQAYGHGVYLADAPEVAGGYKEALRHRNAWEIDGVPYHGVTARSDATAGNYAANALSRFDGDKKTAIKWLMESGSPHEFEAAKILKKAKKISPDSGSLYKADLPDEWIPKMLDWDKPLSEQNQAVKDALKKNWLADADGGHGKQTVPQMLDALKVNLTGSDFDPAGVAKMMQKAGIPGIRYLDGGSRGKGQGSYNYVVFPGLEDQVKILERNGVPLSGLLGGQ